MLTSVYPAVHRLVKSALSGAKIFHEGIWLGLFDHAGLDRLSIRQYGQSGALDRYLDDQHNRSGLFGWEADAVHSFFPSGARVLVAAAGGGREILALRKLGYRADGFDCQPDLAAIARKLLQQEHLDGVVLDAAPDEIPPNSGGYEALIVGWGAYIHIIGRANRIRFLRDFASSAQAGAPVLLSFFPRSPNARRYDAIQRIASFTRRMRLSGDRVEVGDVLDGTFDHYFTESEIKSELSEAGLSVEHYAETPFAHLVARTADTSVSSKHAASESLADTIAS